MAVVMMCLDGWFQDASTLWISWLVAQFEGAWDIIAQQSVIGLSLETGVSNCEMKK
jgi:hypothetical protein